MLDLVALVVRIFVEDLEGDRRTELDPERALPVVEGSGDRHAEQFDEMAGAVRLILGDRAAGARRDAVARLGREAHGRHREVQLDVVLADADLDQCRTGPERQIQIRRKTVHARSPHHVSSKARLRRQSRSRAAVYKASTVTATRQYGCRSSVGGLVRGHFCIMVGRHPGVDHGIVSRCPSRTSVDFLP